MDKRVTRALAISDHNWLEPNDLAAPQFFEPTRPQTVRLSSRKDLDFADLVSPELEKLGVSK
jgi:hypothetical protein